MSNAAECRYMYASLAEEQSLLSTSISFFLVLAAFLASLALIV